MWVSAPLFTNVARFRRASSIETVKGGASLAGIGERSSVSLRVSTRRLAACSLSTRMPRETICAGDQCRLILLAMTSCSSVRHTARSIYMAPYREPRTPVRVSLPPVEAATFCAIICSVVSRPRYQSVPPTITPVTTTPMATRRGQRRLCGAGAGAWVGVLSFVSIRR